MNKAYKSLGNEIQQRITATEKLTKELKEEESKEYVFANAENQAEGKKPAYNALLNAVTFCILNSCVSKIHIRFKRQEERYQIEVSPEVSGDGLWYHD